MTQPPRRYAPGAHPVFTQETQVLQKLSLPTRTDRTEVLPKVTDGRLEHRLEQMEEQLVQQQKEVLRARSHADWSLLAMVVSLACAVLCACALISILLLGG